MKNRRKGIAGVLAAVIAFAGAASRSPQARMIVRELAGSGISLRENTKQKDAGTYQKNSAGNTGGIPDLSSLSASKSQSVIKVNGDSPYFKASDMAKKPFISLSEKDSLGRCRQAKMCAYYTGVASKERGDISSVHPSGWKQAFVKRNGKRYALYNRSHLLLYKLSRLNDNDRNLITGTEYFNQRLMLSVESEVLDYVRSSKEHVIYRVTPVYRGNELVARGVLMEAKSVESNRLRLCRYAPNVEPGVSISYATGQAQSASPSVSVQ